MNMILLESKVVVWLFVLTWSVGITFNFPFLVLYIQGRSHNICSLYSPPADRTRYRGKVCDVSCQMIGNMRSNKLRKGFPLDSSRAGMSVAHFMRSKIGPLPEQSVLVYFYKEGLSTKRQYRMILSADTKMSYGGECAMSWNIYLYSSKHF